MRQDDKYKPLHEEVFLDFVCCFVILSVVVSLFLNSAGEDVYSVIETKKMTRAWLLAYKNMI